MVKKSREFEYTICQSFVKTQNHNLRNKTRI